MSLEPFLTRIRRSKAVRFRRPSTRNLLHPRKWNWKRIFKLIGILAAVLILLFIAVFAWYYKDLPRPGQLSAFTPTASTILYDRNGNQIYDISGDVQRQLITSDKIPKIVKDATISIEDHGFYNEPGVDILGIMRGVILRPLTGHSIQGGSTITQQYVKNAILSPQRTISRKIQELILSLEIDKMYTKDQILTLYLNEIPYGGNVYGIQAAAQTYFNKNAKDLTLPEAATLASIPNLPTYYSPYGSHVDALIARKNLVLNDMAKYGYITQAQADQAKQEAPLKASDFAQKQATFPAPHFVMYVREQLVNMYGEDMVDRGGLRVTTTLDLPTQQVADSTVSGVASKVLPKAQASNAGLVAINPKNGQILAMVGSLNYFDQSNDGEFNVTTALRQSGSAIKPVVYSTLFKGDYSPSSLLWDVKTNFNGYQPQNFDGKFHGPVTVRTAIGNSYNIPAVKALQLEGISNFIKTATDLGLSSLANKQDSGLSLALGSGEVQLTQLTNAYGALANGGSYNPLTSILEVQDNKGKILYKWSQNSKQALSPDIAYELDNMLSDLNAKKPTFSGLLGYLSVKGHTVAAKTGTSNDYRDAWTLGYTPSLVAGVWVGNNNNGVMNHAEGAIVSAPIWQAFMAKELSGKPNENFVQPSDITTQTVDELSGGIPTQYSGPTVSDIFAPWQVPTKQDGVHVAVQVCKENGLLATSSTPADQVETKVFTVVHSEHPTDPNWENPVQAWAQSQGWNGAVPTQTCDITNTNPVVTITSPANGDSVSGIFTIAANVSWPGGVNGTVTFDVDGTAVGTDSTSPYTATIDSSKYSAGSHTITATANGSNGSQGTSSITVNVQASSVGIAGDVSGVSLSSPAKATVTASWTNPSDSNLASVTFYVSQTAGVKGSALGTVDANPGTQQSATLSGLVSGVINYVTFVTRDSNGAVSSSTTQYPIAPQ